MLLNARTVISENSADDAMLLAIEDVSERRAHERELEHLVRQKELLLEEMRHRIANSLQIIASILLLKARSVQSDETRGHLQDAHKRVLSVAAVQQHLQGSGHGEPIAVGPYLSKLCATLAASTWQRRPCRPARDEHPTVSERALSQQASLRAHLCVDWRTLRSL
jgi:chemotaxis protein methyltransferase CheR